MATEALVSIDSSLPGGNIVVEHIEGNEVTVHQDLRDTDGWWFYWCFRMWTTVGTVVTVRFTDGDVIGRLGPAVSYDKGRTWSWLGENSLQPDGFAVYVEPEMGDVCLSVAMPYFRADLDRCTANFLASDHFVDGDLCKSNGGRSVPLLRFGCLGEPRRRVLLTARHHACETMGSYVLEGLMTEVVCGQRAGPWLRENVELVAAPFVDTDGVERGDQGKNRLPHDHNRDYLGESIYPEVASLRGADWIWVDGKLIAAIDLHCPELKGGPHDHLSFIGPPPPATFEEAARFSRALAGSCSGPIKHAPEHDLPFGKEWNTEEDEPGAGYCAWAGQLPGVKLTTMLEIPFALSGDVEVNAATARLLGGDLAQALVEYLAD